MKNLKKFNEKWQSDVEIKKTGKYSDKTITELKDDLKELKKKSKKYQDEDKKVPLSLRKEMSRIIFAIRAKQGWKKGNF